MKFPYGIYDFQRLIEGGYFYVDRTTSIRDIENAGDQLVFLRPRRFGKSLLLSMLENYYDLAKTDRFEALFGHLAIGSDPTSLHNTFIVMKWDFSLIESDGSVGDIRNRLHDHINQQVAITAQKYADHLRFPVTINAGNAIDSFTALLGSVQNSGFKLYLLIDEYDNFANELMMGSSDTHYDSLLRGEGAVRSLFKAVKAASGGMGLERVFITGVSPIAMADITSAYNVATNIYLAPKFNKLCGFTEAEVESVLSEVVQEASDELSAVDKALTMMRSYYNGYCFSMDEGSSVYNPTLTLYFLRAFAENGGFPNKLLDENLAMDSNKIHYIARLAHGDAIISKALDPRQPVVIPEICERFGVRKMIETEPDETFIASLLYYLGALTQTESPYPGEVGLTIPNLVMRKIYLEELQAALIPNRSNEPAVVARSLYVDGDIAPLCSFIQDGVLKAFSNRDYRWSNELTIKTAFLSALFNDRLFIMDSEPELERAYGDLTMIVRSDMRHFDIFDVLLEFKVVTLKEAGMDGAQVAAASDDKLRALPAVSQAFASAESQLSIYIPRLQNKYGEAMKLCTFAVVAVGFERILWQRIPHQGAK